MHSGLPSRINLIPNSALASASLLGGHRWFRAELCPRCHQPSALSKRSPRARRLRFVLEDVRQRRCDDFAREVGALACPIAKNCCGSRAR